MDSTTTTTTQGVTTTFTEDDKVVMNNLISSEVPLTATPTSESIKDFLAKPFLVTNSTWNSTDLQGASLFGTTGFGTDSLLEVSQSWIPKWKGFSMIKATIVYRLQLNANPFQSGKLMMHFLPMLQAFANLDATMDNSYERMHNYDITTKSMQPHVLLDCRETAAVMRIPYVTPASHYPLTTGAVANSLVRYERGAVFLSVLSPLRTGVGGENFVNFSLYAHFEDVELCAPFYPEMGKPQKKSNKPRFSAKALTPADAESKAMANTPVANALSSAAKIAGYATAIPGLADLAGPAQWMLDGAAGVCSFFGWSKPAVDMAPTTVTNQYARYNATSDGGDTSYPLAIRSGNAVSIIDGKSLTSDDEMSFAYLKKIPAITKSVDWTTSQTSGTLLTSFPVGPRHIYATSTYTVTPKSIQLATGPPCYYLSNLFKHYRGGMKMNIKIAKTEYHSGRLEIVYIPRPTGTVPSLANSTMSLREIVDIREGNEITLDLPFLTTVPYLNVEQNFGNVAIRVVNELRVPETAAQSIQLLFYFSATDDFELAVPGYSDNTLAFPPFSPEMESMATVLVDEVIGGQPVVTETMESASLCVGELFTSVRQLIARSSQIWTATIPTATDRIAIWPFFTSVAKLTSTGIVKPKYGGDVFSYVSPMYVFYRGGMRVTMDTAAAVGSLSLTLTPAQVKNGRESFSQSTSLNGTATAVDYFGNAGISPTGTTITNSGVGVLSASLPYYCKTPVSLNVPNVTDKIPFNAGGLEYSVPQSAISVEFQSTPVWFRSVAEDFQFTYFVGCPPVPLAQPVGLFAATVAAEEIDIVFDEENTGMLDWSDPTNM